MTTPTDKSPREFWIYTDESALIVREERNPNAVIEEIHVIEHSAYLAVKQELDATKYDHNQMRGVLDNMKQELEAARAGLRDWKQEAEMRMDIIVRERTQLTDAKAQIKDYEETLYGIIKWSNTENLDDTHQLKVAQKTLNKWKAK